MSWNMNIHVMEAGWRLKRSKYERDLHEGKRPFTLYCVTWNMSGKNAAEEMVKLLPQGPHSHDFYVISLQQAPQTNKLVASLREALGDHYMLLASTATFRMQIYVFCKSIWRPLITELGKDIHLEGAGALLGQQKGAVAVAFNFMHRYFVFVNCFLVGNTVRFETRNDQLNRIRTQLFSKILRQDHFLESTDVVVWMGDFNYRIDLPMGIVEHYLNKKQFQTLKNCDQLIREAEKGEILCGFNEGVITFNPTSTYYIGRDVYHNKLVPAWTDRILWRIAPFANVNSKLKAYDCISDIKASEHRPVKAILEFQFAHDSNTATDDDNNDIEEANILGDWCEFYHNHTCQWMTPHNPSTLRSPPLLQKE